MISLSRLAQRSRLLQSIRAFFISNQYLEVDTPVRLPVIIPERYISPFQTEDCFLQTSPELCMKLLLGRGIPRIFQICHCFRRAESGRLHQEEFTMLEWYHAGWNYHDLMGECEVLFRQLAGELADFAGLVKAGSIERAGKTISLISPWERMSVEEAFQKYAGISAFAALRQDRFEEILVTAVEPNLGWNTPLFLYDYPAELASLARRKKQNRELAERFELYIGGLELANGYSELIDSSEQRNRFTQEIAAINQNTSSLLKMPENLLKALSGMPETAGIALGFDRLFMLLSGREDIAEVMTLSFDDMQRVSYE